jgi:ribA/ribD-fused uncharacterized protein
MAIEEFRGQYRFLSNFWVVDTGVRFSTAIPHTFTPSELALRMPTVEHAFQATKSFDPKERLLVLHKCSPVGTCGTDACTTAGQSKRAAAAREKGGLVTLRPDWESICRSVMVTSVREKFQNPALAKLLLTTGQQELIEGNTWHDRRWGRCTCPQHQGAGENWLGQILMRVREDLQADILKPFKAEPPKQWAPLCIHCGETLGHHGRFARCEGGATQFTPAE